MEHGSQFHGVDHEFGLGQFEPDDLEKVAGGVGADSEHLGRVSVRVEINVDDDMLDGMQDDSPVVTVLERRTMELHTRVS